MLVRSVTRAVSGGTLTRSCAPAARTITASPVPASTGSSPNTSASAITAAGFTLVVVTNQPDVGNGYVTRDVVAVRTSLQDAGIDYESAETSFLPSMQVEVDEDTARKVLKLIDALEDSDDVQNVFANFDVSDEVLEALDA